MNRASKRIITSLLLLVFLLGGFSTAPLRAFAEYRVIEYSDGDIFKGNVLQNSKKDGSGTYTFIDGTIITGNWRNGVLEEKVHIEYPNGEEYIGGFKNGVKYGKGKYYFENGDVYNGSWKNDKMHGKGKYTWDNEWSLSGKWKKGKINGKCKLKTKKYIYTIKCKKGKLKKIISKRKR